MAEGLFVVSPQIDPSLEDAAAQPPDGGSQKRTRIRSQVAFPYNDLEEAQRVARAVHDRGGRQCSEAQVAAALNHDSVAGGAFRLKLSAARMFGLVEFNDQSVKLTQLGIDLVESQSGPTLRVEAFLNVPLYRLIYKKYEGYKLPGSAGLEGEMQTLGVSPKIAERARQVFQRSAEQAGLYNAAKDRLLIPASTQVSQERPLNAAAGPGMDLPERESMPTGNQPMSTVSARGRTGGGVHPMIQALVDALPDHSLAKDKQKQWLQAAEWALSFIYDQPTEDS